MRDGKNTNTQPVIRARVPADYKRRVLKLARAKLLNESIILRQAVSEYLARNGV